jgi:methionyl aminopeptidase
MKPKSSEEIEIMREGGRRLAKILNELGEMVRPGVSGREISDAALAKVKKADMQPVLIGFQGYSDVMCISVNDAIVHGIPNTTPFKEGDVVKLDLTLGYKSLVVDSAITVIAGASASKDVKRLLDGTKMSLMAGINAIKGDGTRVGDIGSAVQDVLNKNKLGIIRDLVGHGVGYGIHEDPNIPNYGVAGTGPALMSGMTIAVEPMAALGDWQVNISKDGWTVMMADHSLSAHFEHTVLITDDGAEILTSVD